MLTRDFQALLQALQAKSTPNLPPLLVQYTDYAAWQRHRLDAGQLEASIAYWKGKLTDAPVMELPTDRPYPLGGLSAKGDVTRVVVPKQTAAALRRLAAECGTTLYTIMLAAWKVCGPACKQARAESLFVLRDSWQARKLEHKAAVHGPFDARRELLRNAWLLTL